MEFGLSWNKLLPLAEGLRPHPHANSNSMRRKALVGTSRCSSPVPLLPLLLTEFSLAAWDAKVKMARVYPPIWPTCPSVLSFGAAGTLGHYFSENVFFNL